MLTANELPTREELWLHRAKEEPINRGRDWNTHPPGTLPQDHDWKAWLPATDRIRELELRMYQLEQAMDQLAMEVFDGSAHDGGRDAAEA